MAVDTQIKRASVLGIVQPDATIDQGDRQTLLGVYAGILAVLADGLVSIAWSVTRPLATMTAAAPGVALTGAAPGIALTGEG